MANRYKNAQFDLNSTNKTDIYTCPSNSRAIIQNIHTANVGAGNIEIKAFIYDNSVTTSFQFAEHTVNSGTSKSIADGTIILEESDILKIETSDTAGISAAISLLELSRE